MPALSRSGDLLTDANRRHVMRLLAGERPWPLYLWYPGSPVPAVSTALWVADMVPRSIYRTMDWVARLAEGVAPDGIEQYYHLQCWRQCPGLCVLSGIGEQQIVSDTCSAMLTRLLRLRQLAVVLAGVAHPGTLGYIYGVEVYHAVYCGTKIRLSRPDDAEYVLGLRRHRPRKGGRDGGDHDAAEEGALRGSGPADRR